MLRPAPVLMTGQSRGSRLDGGFEFAGVWDRTAVPESDLTDLSMWEAAALLRRGKVSASELLDAYLDRVDRWDGVYMAFNLVMRESAVLRARQLDDQDPVGILHGLPMGIKDNFYTRDVLTTANSHVFAGFVPDHDATVVARLRGSGAVLLGKTQMGPLATTRALTPDGDITTVNAWAPADPTVSPGGSSSGSATAVAARMAGSSIATQTGGSITNPALAQGLTGLKPTMGRVSLHGVIPLTHTRDHPGPIARDARDAAMVLQTIAGPDSSDARTLGLPSVPDYLTAATPVMQRRRPAMRWPTRLGVPPGWADAGSTRRRRARRLFLSELERLGVRIIIMEPPPRWDELTSRSFNAVRLAERSELYLDILRKDVRLFGVALPSWINGLLISGDEYLKGQRARVALLRLTIEQVFDRCDLVVQDSPIPFDMVGLPLISFPIGHSESSLRVLPEGVIVGGPPFGEERLLALAAAWQEVTDWHRRHPADPEVGVPEGGNGSRRGRLQPELVADSSE